MGRPKAKKNSVCLSVTMDESEYSELTCLAPALDLSAVWIIRRAVLEFAAHHREGIKPEMLLTSPKVEFPNILI